MMTDSEKYKPFVSVIVPVYNGMSTLPALLDSIEKQDHTGQMEVIIVDDGSKDESAEFSESRGFIVIRQENKGPGLARNAGAAAARGELLVFTDADCILDENFMTELIKPLQDSEIIGSQGVFYSTQKSLVARFIQAEVLERFEREAKVDYIDWVATYAACYRKDVFLENGGFNDTYSSEDAELSFRLASLGYKMVLAQKARTQHKNYENFFKFIWYKYKRAYWTIWLYKTFPDRAFKDELTPPSRKTMMLLMAGSVFFFILSLWIDHLEILGYIFALLLLFSTFKFSINVIKDDLILGLTAPIFLISRTVCYIAGFAHGLVDFMRGKRTAKKSSSK